MQERGIKRTRLLLLKNPENLDQGRKEAERLEEALRLNQPLSLSYYLKNYLRQLWHQPNKVTAVVFLEDWLARAQTSGIPFPLRFSKTLALHRRGLLTYYDYFISTGPSETTNSKIRTMQRPAYGFRDHEFFKLKVLALHETRYALFG
jgi:transposase